MADIYEFQLTLDLPSTLPEGDLAVLRWHLGHEDGEQGDYAYPLWDARGPARRIGGVLVGELRSDDWGWALTVRQESHPDELDDMNRIVNWLAARTTTAGVIGYLRFYEDDVPDVLVAQSGSVRCMTLRAEHITDPGERALPDPRA
ncbi:hypothetical protein [Streptomyces sp. enrichment culture]|uniref:hypothetical protein n=1 Tax=Streptomyces sp. enrichment culture TaxID=1795815 RepID=UPI003F577399